MIEYLVNSKKIDRKKRPIYYVKEKSFLLEPQIETDFSILFGNLYFGLDIDLNTGKVQAISGYSPKRQWKRNHLIIPKATVEGELIVLSNDEWYPGQGIRVTDGDWGIQYDSKTGWICVGKSGVEMVGQSVEFLNNCIAVLNGKSLEEIFIHADIIK